GGGDARVTVAEDQGAPGADVVEVAVPVEVDEVGALAAGDEDGLAADAAEGAGGAVDAPGDQVAGAAGGFLAAGAVHAGDAPFCYFGAGPTVRRCLAASKYHGRVATGSVLSVS